MRAGEIFCGGFQIPATNRTGERSLDRSEVAFFHNVGVHSYEKPTGVFNILRKRSRSHRLGQAINGKRRATDFISKFVLGGGDKSRLHEEIAAIVAGAEAFLD